MAEGESVPHDPNFPPAPYPFPERASGIVEKISLPNEIPLTLEQRQTLLGFEEGLFEEVKRLKGILVDIHTIYPKAFTRGKGARLFAAVYLDESLGERIIGVARKHGVELEDRKTTEDEKREIYDAFFDDLLEISSSENKFLRYQQEGIRFRRFTASLGIEDDLIRLKGEITDGAELDEELIRSHFISGDLKRVPERIRKRAGNYSSDFARKEFIQKFRKAKGDITKVSNPERVSRVVDIQQFNKKIKGWRALKRRIKDTRRGLKDSNLSQAKEAVLNLYQRFINVQIAGLHEGDRVIATRPKGTINRPSRTMQRIDRFLQGVGIYQEAQGLRYRATTQILDEYAQVKITETVRVEKRSVLERSMVNADQAVRLGQLILNLAGFDNWRVIKSDTVKSFKIQEKKTKETGGEERVCCLLVPSSLTRSVRRTIVGFASELAHISRIEAKRSAFKGNLYLFEEYTSGRGGVLAEGADKYFSNTVSRMLGGRGGGALPYYYLIIKKKAEGASFKECFLANLQVRLNREGKTWKSILPDEEGMRRVYNATLRIFRRHTPLNDTSGFVPDSRQLCYLEGELVGRKLIEAGLGKLVFLSGVDLYSLADITRLGVLNLSEIKEQDLSFIGRLGKSLTSSLSSGKSMDQALKEAEELRPKTTSQL